MKLDRGAVERATSSRARALKQFLWITFALWTGFTFVGFFTPIRALGRARSRRSRSVPGKPSGSCSTASPPTATPATCASRCASTCVRTRASRARCSTSDTLIITYDAERGEPRGARKRGTDPRAQGLGDCIDCTLCVQVCPTGIDIRKGLQIECIACAACIDACDDVMDKMGTPRGLIRYTTQHALEHQPTRVLRPRMLIYGGLLARADRRASSSRWRCARRCRST